MYDARIGDVIMPQFIGERAAIEIARIVPFMNAAALRPVLASLADFTGITDRGAQDGTRYFCFVNTGEAIVASDEKIVELSALLDPPIAAHDPVFISADKTVITANGIDAAIITVSAPKQAAAAVSLLVAGTIVPVSLTNGVGTVEIASDDPASILVSVQNPTNRCLDTITIEAV
jgi:hypothetical protein